MSVNDEIEILIADSTVTDIEVDRSDESAPVADSTEEAPEATEKSDETTEVVEEEVVAEEKSDEVVEEATDEAVEEKAEEASEEVVEEATEEKTEEEPEGELVTSADEKAALIMESFTKGDAIDYRAKRLETMGEKSLEADDFLCASERTLRKSAEGVCSTCRGGCCAEKDANLPGLLDIEGIAEVELKGTVLDSGYSDIDDMYVVDVLQADGRKVEAFISGSGELLGWRKLQADVEGQKSAAIDGPTDIISIEDAEEIAKKNLAGDVIGVDADIFQGFDAYAVSIEGENGKSYEAFVSLDGVFMGYDEYIDVEDDDEKSLETEATEEVVETEEKSDEEVAAELKAALVDGTEDPEFLASLAEFKEMTDGDTE